MNRLLKAGLALGCAGAAGALWRIAHHEPTRKYAPSERPPYAEFENRVLIVGGGFAGYTTAKTLGELTEGRDDVGVMVVSRENFFTYWPMVAGIISSDVETKNVAQPLRRALVQYGASFRRAEMEDVDLFEVFSAGTEATHVNPLAVRSMDEIRIGISAQRSEKLDRYVGESFGYVITIRDEANEACPAFPGAKHRLHWYFVDPARATGGEEERSNVFREVRDRIRERIGEELLPAALPY